MHHQVLGPLKVSRRAFLITAGMVGVGGTPLVCNPRRVAAETEGDTYENHVAGIRIVAGQWRPHYPWEQIAWISPPWPSQDYLWLDFPEAIFSSQGLLYLSHVNPPIQTVFHDLPAVAWQPVSGGIAFERTLPNGVAFGGRVTRGKGPTVNLELHIENGSQTELSQIRMQTCAFLRAIEEFADFSRANKYVHVPRAGWVPIDQAANYAASEENYRVGWQTRDKRVADLPVAVALSNNAQRLVAMTWFADTLTIVDNPRHPCFHADPKFPDLAPGERASIQGKMIFFAGALHAFDPANFPQD